MNRFLLRSCTIYRRINTTNEMFHQIAKSSARYRGINVHDTRERSTRTQDRQTLPRHVQSRHLSHHLETRRR